jgi:ATP-dependent helicase Lhr and Lhr-like helicase
MPSDQLEAIIEFMVSAGLLSSDNGLLWIGGEGEDAYGRRHFMELLSSFTSPPLFRVQHGQHEIGLVDQISFVVRREQKPILLLAGRSWQVTHMDWNGRVAYVTPSEAKGRSQWMGSSSPLSFELCQSIRQVLAADDTATYWSVRAREAIDAMRSEFPWCRGDGTTVVATGEGTCRWWTFAGLRANAALAESFRNEGVKAVAENFFLQIHADQTDVQSGVLDRIRSRRDDEWPTPSPEAALDLLKFSECLPRESAMGLLRARLLDLSALRHVTGESVTYSS